MKTSQDLTKNIRTGKINRITSTSSYVSSSSNNTANLFCTPNGRIRSNRSFNYCGLTVAAGIIF